jgi:hypothetical protein
MYKNKIEKAEERFKRISINPNATAQDKKDALEHVERIKKVSEEPEKYHESTEGFLSGVQKLATGLLGIGLSELGVGHTELEELIPDPVKEKIVEGAVGVVGTLAGDKIGSAARKGVSANLTDTVYPESTYPKASSQRMKTGSNYFDDQGNRWTLSSEYQSKLKEIEDREAKTREIFSGLNLSTLPKSAQESILKKVREKEQEDLLKKYGHNHGHH